MTITFDDQFLDPVEVDCLLGDQWTWDTNVETDREVVVTVTVDPRTEWRVVAQPLPPITAPPPLIIGR